MARRREQQTSPSSDFPEFETDDTYGEPWALAIKDRWYAGDWRGARSLLDQAPSIAVRDHMLVQTPSADSPRAPHMLRWLQEAPDDPLAKSMYGRHLVHVAWEIRGSGRASTVSASQFTDFFETLRAADAWLMDTARAHPEEHLPWRFLLGSAMGLQIALEEIGDRYFEVEERIGIDYDSVWTMVQVAAPKWRGSEPELMHFARDIYSRVPEGDPMAVVIANAWIEMILEDDDLSKDMRGRAEVRGALEKSRLLDPNHRLDPVGIQARNTFAAALWNFRDNETSAALLRILGWHPQRITDWPWDYWMKPERIWRFGRQFRAW